MLLMGWGNDDILIKDHKCEYTMNVELSGYIKNIKSSGESI